MALHVGWRSFFWLNVALLGVSFVCLLFLLPETKWSRMHPRTAAAVSVGEPLSSTGKADEPEVEQYESVIPESTGDRPRLQGSGRPSMQQFRLWQPGNYELSRVVHAFWVPWKLLSFPIVQLAGFMVSWAAATFLVLNVTQSEVFSAAPYHFSSQTIGFFNFALFIGACMGLALTGPLLKLVSMRATRRNGGVREPEMQLPTLLPFAIMSIVSSFIVGYGYQEKWDWKVVTHFPPGYYEIIAV